jgi:hypothetical protein
MRRLSLLLCFTLFASLIHAGAVDSIWQSGSESYLEQMTHHDCHTQQISTADEGNKSSNHHATYQCCVGVIANSAQHQQLQASFSAQLVPKVSQLPIDVMPEHIFKPPKQMS